MNLSAEQSCRVTASLGVALLWANDAHAQRIPIEAVWSAGAGLFAPFVAVPIKIGLVRFSKVDVPSFRPWSLSLIEWVIWFPTAVVFLGSSDSNLIPVVVPALFALSTWLHRAWIAKASWVFASFLSLLTPALVVALPLLAFATIAYLQSLSA